MSCGTNLEIIKLLGFVGSGLGVLYISHNRLDGNCLLSPFSVNSLLPFKSNNPQTTSFVGSIQSVRLIYIPPSAPASLVEVSHIFFLKLKSEDIVYNIPKYSGGIS